MGTALAIVTPTILPVFVALGVTFGLFELGKSAYKFATAKNGRNDAENAFYDLGAGIADTGMAVLEQNRH